LIYSKPLVSILIPAYNVEDEIERCIESALEQTYKNIEIIVINDGSTDGTLAKIHSIKDIDGKLNVYSVSNGGVAKSRNIAISKASGDFITFIDADDTVDDDYVEYLVTIQKKFNTAISSCQHRVHYYNGQVKDYALINYQSRVWTAHDWCSDILSRINLDLSTVCKLYRKELFDNILFPEGELFEDTATTYRLVLNNNEIAVGVKSKYNYVLRNNSITRSSFDDNYLELIAETKKMVNEILIKFPDLIDQSQLRVSWAETSVLNSIILSGAAREYNVMLDNLRKDILKNYNVILSSINSDYRLKLVAIALKVGLRPYFGLIKILKVFKN